MRPSDLAATFAAVEHLTARAVEVKATGPESSGAFEAIVSVFGNVDKGGDRMIPGCFKTSLKSPDEGGRGYPPVVWSHQWGVVPIGVTQKAEEVTSFKTEKGEVVDGLYVAGDFFVDSHEVAKQAYTAMTRKGGDDLPALRDWSFGYEIKRAMKRGDEGFEPITKAHIRDLVEVELFEVGPTLVGMNPAAGTVGMKSLEPLLEALKAGARNSMSDKEMLQQIHDLTGELGIECAGKSARPQMKTLHGAMRAQLKGYDDIDSYAIYLLCSMIEQGAAFILGEPDPADVERMRNLIGEVAAMLAEEIGEQEAGADVGEPDEEGVVGLAMRLIDSGAAPDVGTKKIEAAEVDRLMAAGAREPLALTT